MLSASRLGAPIIRIAFLKGCRRKKKDTNSTLSVCSVCVCQIKDLEGQRVESTYPNVVRRHGLQVGLKGLPPFDGGLELVNFDQVIWREGSNAVRQHI